MERINSSKISFRSTVVPINAKKPLVTYIDRLKNCNLISIKESSVEKCYKDLFEKARNENIYRTGVMIDKDANNNTILRFFGYCKENDEYIYSMIKKIDKDAKYIKDVPDDGYQHGSLEMYI